MKRVVVLGCGPAGLMAAHAASMYGCELRIYSIKQPSEISGAQYIHEPVPGLTGYPDGNILYSKVGTRDVYAQKVYGHADAPVSWDLWEPGTRQAWSMQRVYGILWKMYRGAIGHYAVNDPEDIHRIEQLGADLYISSLPAPKLCEKDHIFQSVPMRIIRDKNFEIPPNMIIYNGLEKDSWCRASNMFGHQSVEYGQNVKSIPSMSIIEGFKPTAHDCSCNPHWMRVGRFGKWQRGVLVHHAYKEVMDALHKL